MKRTWAFPLAVLVGLVGIAAIQQVSRQDFDVLSERVAGLEDVRQQEIEAISQRVSDLEVIVATDVTDVIDARELAELPDWIRWLEGEVAALRREVKQLDPHRGLAGP